MSSWNEAINTTEIMLCVSENKHQVTRSRFAHKEDTGCLLRGVPEVLSNISLVFGDRDLVFYMKMLYYGTFDNQKMIWPISPTRYFKWLCQKSLKIYTIFTNSSLSSMFFKNFNFEAFRGIFWPWWRKQKSLRIKFYPRKHPWMSFLGQFWVRLWPQK